MRRLVGTVATAVLACALAGPATASPARPLERDGGSLLAHVEVPAAVRAAPDPRARAIGRVTGRTAWSHRREALMVTGLRRGPDGRRWVRVQLPVRPNGTAGWVPKDSVRLSVVRTRIVVHRSARRLEVWRDGRRIHAWRAGVGRAATPTPLGVFAIQDPMRTLPEWRGVYGGWTLTLTAHSEVLRSFMGGDGLVAIHGGSLGRVGRPSSNGCVILSEAHLATLARIVRPGTPVEIRD